MSDYADILKQSWADIPQPKLLPVGSWELRCTSAKLAPPKQADQKVQVQFSFAPVEPMSDVSDEALQELGTDDYSAATEAIFHRMFFSSPSDKQKVRTLLLRLGVANVDELSVEQSLKAAVNGTAVAYLVQESYQAKSGETGVKNAISHFINKE